MSIQQLTEDLQTLVIPKAKEPGALDTSDGIKAFLLESLLPWLESQAEEMDGMDEAIDGVVRGSVDLLHARTSAQVIAVIEGAKLLINDFRTRVGNDQRILKGIKEWNALAEAAKNYLLDITVEDEEEDDDDAEGEEGDDAPAPPVVTT